LANRDIQAARDFHTGTSHPGGHLFDPRHRYVPGREPLLAKIYPELPAIPLPLDRSPGEMHALAAISPAPGPPTGPAVPDLPTLARILYFTAGITKWLRLPHSRERQPFRAAACTGALYHIEVYVVSGDLPGLEAGVYHFDPIETALRRLRVGDHRRFLVHAAGSEPHVVRAPLAMVFTDVFARNAYKYQARAYRHAFWDSGTMISHTLAMAARHGLPARVVLGFIDTHISRLLGLRPEEELPLAIVPVGWSEQATSPTAEEPEPLRLRVHPISSPPLDSPAIWKTHHASSLTSVDEVAAWRAAAGGSERPQQGEGLVELPSLPPEAWPPAPVEQVILRRGSSREFSRHPIQRELAGTILSRALVQTILRRAGWR
jgi:SagB-type dehydrogenase family enzyme